MSQNKKDNPSPSTSSGSDQSNIDKAQTSKPPEDKKRKLNLKELQQKRQHTPLVISRTKTIAQLKNGEKK